MTPAHSPGRTRRDLAWLVATLGLVLAWDLAGQDLAVSRWFGTAQGFAWRDHWLAAAALHDGGRWLGLGTLVLLAFDAWRPLGPGPARAVRGFWWSVMLASALLVPALKRTSLSSCPWDLADFGGRALYVPHWWFGVADGGPGHCFPSGHAVSAFALLGLHFLWRDTHPRRARWLLAAVLALGALFGAAQVVRGAHFVSHVLWSGWVCAALAVAAAALAPRWARWWARWRGRRQAARPGRTAPASPG